MGWLTLSAAKNDPSLLLDCRGESVIVRGNALSKVKGVELQEYIQVGIPLRWGPAAGGRRLARNGSCGPCSSKVICHNGHKYAPYKSLGIAHRSEELECNVGLSVGLPTSATRQLV